MAEWPWYISAAAVRDYLAITGRESNGEDEAWAEAEEDLGDWTLAAKLSRDEPAEQRQTWRTGRAIRGRRLEFTVLTAERPEGDKPALVRVRLK